MVCSCNAFGYEMLLSSESNFFLRHKATGTAKGRLLSTKEFGVLMDSTRFLRMILRSSAIGLVYHARRITPVIVVRASRHLK